MTTRTMTAEREAERALNCLYIAVDESVAKDVAVKVHAWIHGERQAHQETQAKLELATREIRVAAAVIEQDGLVRIFRRGGNDSYTGKWEFPGGKAEPGESLADALRRELREELAVESEIGAELDHYQYKYAKRGLISLTFFSVKLLGSPEFLEHTESAWVKPEQLADYDLMNGDMRFVATRYVLTRQLAEMQAKLAFKESEVKSDMETIDIMNAEGLKLEAQLAEAQAISRELLAALEAVCAGCHGGSWNQVHAAIAKARGVLPEAPVSGGDQ